MAGPWGHKSSGVQSSLEENLLHHVLRRLDQVEPPVKLDEDEADLSGKGHPSLTFTRQSLKYGGGHIA